MQIPSGHPGVHFEWLCRGRGQNRAVDVALHAETASKEDNEQICLFLKDRGAGLLESSLGQAATFEAVGNPKGWTSVYIRKPYEKWNDDVARWAAEHMFKFMKVVKPLVDQFYAEAIPA